MEFESSQQEDSYQFTLLSERQVESSHFMQQSDNFMQNSIIMNQLSSISDENIFTDDIMEKQSTDFQMNAFFSEFENQSTLSNTKSTKPMFQQTLSIKKSIVKTKRTSSKRFKRKQYQQSYTNFVEFQSSDSNFMVFGYVQIEKNYQDLSENCLEGKSLLCDKVLSINHAINNKVNKRVEFHLDPIGKSGLQDFNELINYLNSQDQQEYQKLGSELQTYQSTLPKMVAHMKQLKKMLMKKVISENDLKTKYDESHKYLLEYLNLRQSTMPNQTFSQSFFFRSNVTHCDTEMYETHLSHQFLELLGVNPEDSKNLIQISSPYSVQSGAHRLNNSLTILQIINSNQKFHKNLPITIQTTEGIMIETTIDVEVISCCDRPVWMNRFDSFMIFVTFNLDQAQIQRVQQLRELTQQKQQQQQEIFNRNFMNKGIEEQAKFELFIEKYYPQYLSNNQ